MGSLAQWFLTASNGDSEHVCLGQEKTLAGGDAEHACVGLGCEGPGGTITGGVGADTEHVFLNGYMGPKFKNYQRFLRSQ